MPKVSVVIATYNRAHFVCEAIDSILNQTFKDYEIIVVDDGSTDNTKDVINKYTARIQYFYQKNLGRAEARNTGIRVAQGEYLAFLDDDDIWLPHKLEKQINCLDSYPDIGLLHTFTEIINEGGRLLKKETENRLKLYKKAMKIGYTYEGMSQLCVMFLSTVIVRRNCFNKVGLFDPAIAAFEDWDFYLRFALQYHISILPEFLVKSRIHDRQSTTDDFIQGRIYASIKNLAKLDSGIDFPFTNRSRHNFYMHLARTYYIKMQLRMFRNYALKAIKLNPLVIFQSRLGIHFLVSLVPMRIVQIIRQLRTLQVNGVSLYPERIIPQETSGGPLIVHLKRYDFAKQFCANKVVLDIACGTGYGVHYLAETAKEVIGVDVSKEAIAYARGHYQRKNTEFKMMDAHKLEFPDKCFDMVSSFETLEHLQEPVKFISEVKRVLKDDGIFVLSTPHAKRATYNPINPYHKVEFSQKDFAELLNKYFIGVEIFGQRRLQSSIHYYLQKIDIFNLRPLLPTFFARKICRTLATRPWAEVNLEDFIIAKEGIKRATELIGVCRDPKE